MKTRYLITGFVLVAALAGGVFYLKAKQTEDAKGAGHQMSDEFAARRKGPASAPVQISVYSDFQCPACKRALTFMNEFETAYSGKISVIFRHFPLRGHIWSDMAHTAAECAARQGKFWAYHDQLYASQEKWSGPTNPLEDFLKLAAIAGLDLDQIGSCMSDESVRTDIQRDKDSGTALQVNSTPTFFINGERVVGPVQLKVQGEKIIRQALGLPALPEPAATPDVPPAPVQASAPPSNAG